MAEGWTRKKGEKKLSERCGQGDQIRLRKKIAQDVAQPCFLLIKT
jgi:hypothetical protein